MSIIDRAGEKLKLRQGNQGENEKRENSQEISQKNMKPTGTSAPMLEQIGEMILDGVETKHSNNNGDGNTNKRIISIDFEDIRRQGFLPSKDSQDLLTNAFRRIKRPLLGKMTGRGKGKQKVEHADRIMVTSALPEEGKTFAAFNLALSLAQEKDWQVILVDCDNIRQTITSFLRLRGQKGFFDALSSDEFPISETLIETSIKNFFVVPSGTHYQQAAELLSSKRMEAVLTQLKSGHTNRIILFDTPPLLGMSESMSVSEHVGQVVFVVKAGSTQRQIVADALEVLDDSKAIGFLLNQTALTQDEGYNGIYDYYKAGKVQ